MCDSCGCAENAQSHSHKHMHEHESHEHGHTHTPGHHHDHEHDHEHPHDADASGESRVVQVERRVLARNDQDAAANRAWLQERNIIAVNLISSPGTGKTLLLEKTLENLHSRIPCAVITGDQQTDNDARRLMGKGAPVCQIETQSACHLNAAMIGDVLPELVTDETRLLFIENVGNLVCPAAFDLGEHFKIALLSTPEGEDKPLKYPVLFRDAQVTVLTKLDLVDALGCDLGTYRRNLQAVHHGMFVFELSARTGQGMDAWLDYLKRLVA